MNYMTLMNFIKGKLHPYDVMITFCYYLYRTFYIYSHAYILV